MDLNAYASKYFRWRELVATSHRTIDNTPPDDVRSRLGVLAREFLDPLREACGPLWCTSGYRCPTLNLVIGGSGGSDTLASNASAHMFGCAADVVPVDTSVHLEDMIAWVVASPLPFDQVIIEHSSTADWLHIGMLRPNREHAPRRQALRFDRGSYSLWVPKKESA